MTMPTPMKLKIAAGLLLISAGGYLAKNKYCSRPVTREEMLMCQAKCGSMYKCHECFETVSLCYGIK